MRASLMLLAACGGAAAPVASVAPPRSTLVAPTAVTAAIEVPDVRVPVRRGDVMYAERLGRVEPSRMLPAVLPALSTDAAAAGALARLVAARDAAVAAREKIRREHVSRDALSHAAQDKAAIVAERERARKALDAADKVIDVATGKLFAALAGGALAKHLTPDGIVVRLVLAVDRARDAADAAYELVLDAAEKQGAPPAIDRAVVDWKPVLALVNDPATAALDPAHAAAVATVRGFIAIDAAAADADQRARELVALARTQPSVRETAAHAAARWLADHRGPDRALGYEAYQLLADATHDPQTRAAALLDLAIASAREAPDLAIPAACGAGATDASFRDEADDPLVTAIVAAPSIDPVVRACDASPAACPCVGDPLLRAGMQIAERDRDADARQLIALGLAHHPSGSADAAEALCTVAQLARADEALGDTPPAAAMGACPARDTTPLPVTPVERARFQLPLRMLGRCVAEHGGGGRGDDPSTLVVRLALDARGTVIGRPAPIQSTLAAGVAPCVDAILAHHRWRGLGATTQLTLNLTFDP